MKEYIKKFADASATNNYAIADIPFMTSVATNPVLNLVCNESGKKLVNTGGVVTVENTTPQPIISQFYVTDADSGHDVGMWSFEVGMTWTQFVNSEYNNDEFFIDGNDVKYYYSKPYYKNVEAVEANEVINEYGCYSIY